MIKNILSFRSLSLVLSGIIAAPVSVLIHELGHYIPYRLFGFEKLVLHADRIEYARRREFWYHIETGDVEAASEIYPIWQIIIGSAGGPIMTLATILICCAVVVYLKPYPFFIAIGLVAPLRSFFLVPLVIFSSEMLLNNDEGRLQLLTGIPAIITLLIGFVAGIVAYYIIIKHIPRENRTVTLVWIFCGIIIGLTIHMTLVETILLKLQ